MAKGRTAAAVAATVVLVALAAATAGAAEYDVHTAESVPVPERTVEQGGDTFTVTAIGRADPGERVDVRVTAPDGAPVAVYLYNDDRQIVASREGTGSGSFTLALDGYAAGTYTFVLQHDGVREAAHPLVVRGYAVDVRAPSDVAKGEDLRVSVDATKLRGDDLARVEVVVADGDTTVRRTASRSGDGTYVATVDTAGFDAGTYRVYANVRGPDTAQGEAEILGLADPTSTTVEASGAPGGGSTPADGTATATDDTAPGTPGGSGTVVTPRPGGTTAAARSTTGTAPTHVPVVLGVGAVTLALLVRLRRRG
ncbi:MAG: hypothetical protein ABEJ61_09515 [Haloferacaceae archaeon]